MRAVAGGPVEPALDVPCRYCVQSTSSWSPRSQGWSAAPPIAGQVRALPEVRRRSPGPEAGPGRRPRQCLGRRPRARPWRAPGTPPRARGATTGERPHGERSCGTSRSDTRTPGVGKPGLPWLSGYVANAAYPLLMLIVASTLAPAQGLSARQRGVKRTELQRHSLSVPGREVIQVRVELEPGVTFGKHWHPGEELVLVVATTAPRSPRTLSK